MKLLVSLHARVAITMLAGAGFAFHTPASTAQTLTFQPGVTRVAGTGTAGSGGTGASALSAKIKGPHAVVQDALGNIYFTDSGNNIVDRIDGQTGILTTIAGGGTVCAGATDTSGDGCPATQSVLNGPEALAFDTVGNLYVTELGTPYYIHEINMTTGIITKVAGSSTNCSGTSDTVGDGCPATQAELTQPDGLAIDSAGDIFESELIKEIVRRIDGTTGIINKWAGIGSAGSSGEGKTGITAKVYYPAGLVLDNANNLYIADSKNDLVRMVTPANIITTFAGVTTNSTSPTSPPPNAGNTGDGGAANAALLNGPLGVAFSQGNVFIADTGNNRIRVVNPSQIISAYAGAATTVCATGDALGNNCAASQSTFNMPYGLFADTRGGLLLADSGNNEIRRVALGNDFGSVAVASTTPVTREAFVKASQAATITAATTATGFTEFSATGLAGCATGTALASGATCGINLSFLPKLPGLRGTTLSVATSDGSFANLGVRGVGLSPAVTFTPENITTSAGTGASGFVNSTTPMSAKFSANAGLAMDSTQSLYIADVANNAIRRVDGINGAVTTVAGTGTAGHAGDGGAGTSATLNAPAAVALDLANARLLIADTANHTIRAVNPQGIITVIAGTEGTSGSAGDGGLATSALLNSPAGVVADNAGNVYIADTANNVVREVTPAGTISTIAGTGKATYTGDGGAATAATLSGPTGLAVDLSGNVYIADTGNHSIRKITVSTGVITTYAGSGLSGYIGDGSAATAARLNGPRALAVDAAGNLLVADTGNSAVRFVLASTGVISTAAGFGTAGYTGDGSQATLAKLSSPAGVAVDGAGNFFVSDTGNNVIRSVPRASAPTISYGSQAVGTTSPAQTVVVLNPGNQPLTFSSIAVTKPFALAANPSGDCTTSTALASGASCTLSVVFSPTTTGAASGTLTLQDNSLNNTSSTQVIPLVFANSALATTTTLTYAPATNPAVYGESLTLTATVTELPTNTNAYTGSVAFSDGVTQIGSSSPNISGIATYTLTPGAGSHSYTAYFIGDSGHGASQSGSAALTINQATTQITLSASSLSPRITTPVTLTATIVPQNGGVPSGTVTFSANGTALGTAVNVVSGTATLVTSALPVGANAITAAYSGDSNFLKSSQGGVTVTVAIVPDFTITASPAALTIPAGQSGAVYFTMTPSYNYTGTITLACGTLPANVACRFIPASVSATGTNSALSAELLITTGGASASQAVTAQMRLATSAVLALFGLPFLWLVRDRRRSFFAATLLLAAVLSSVTGCSSNIQVPPTASPGTSSIVVTATGSSGNAVHTSTVTLTVQ